MKKKVGEFTIEPNFYCDYGFNIEIGENFYSNHNLVILDANKVKFGNNVVIGAGSVVTKDVPSDVVAYRKSLQSCERNLRNNIEFYA